MRGKYTMDEFEAAKWRFVFSQIISILSQDESYQANLTNHDICPINIEKTLENLGWELEYYERDGCDADAWYSFQHPGYEFKLLLQTDSDTFEMKLSRH